MPLRNPTTSAGGGSPTTSASDLTSGTLADARLSSNVTLNGKIFTATVAPSGGDYTTLGAAFAAGKYDVLLKNGTYNETAPLNIPAGTNLRIQEQSKRGVILNFNAGTGACIAGASSESSNLTLDQFLIRDLTIKMSAAGLTAGIDLGKSYETHIENIHGLLGVAPSAEAAFIVMTASENAFASGKLTSSVLTGVTFAAYPVAPTSAFTVVKTGDGGWTIDGVRVDANSAAGFTTGVVVNGQHTTLSNVFAKKCLVGVSVTATDCVLTNIATRQCGTGVVNTADNVAISNVSGKANSTYDLETTGSSCSFANIQGDAGIHFTGLCNNCSTVGGSIYTSNTAITLEASTNTNSFVGVNVNASATPLSDAGTGNVFVGCIGIV